MEFYLFDKNKKKITYNKILNLDFEKDLYIPCAGFKATLLANDNFNIENVSKIKSFLLKIKSDVLYYGVIDTACAEFIGQSITLKLKGRDNMAYLLDSEADTTTFINAKLSDMGLPRRESDFLFSESKKACQHNTSRLSTFYLII